MKHFLGVQTRAGARRFRGRKVAASLKPGQPDRPLRRLRRFRGRKVAASLKRLRTDLRHVLVHGFRGRKVAASLKPTRGAAVVCVLMEIPRPKGRGLIEAP